MAYQPSAEAAHVTELRKSGKLKESYDYAKAEFIAGNREDTFMSAYTWVLHDCLKRYFDSSSRFYQDTTAFVRTLAQIRSFPIDEARDGLFIDNLTNKVRTVIWEQVKQNNIENTQRLAFEVCQWRRGEALYSTDIARPLLVGLKADCERSGLVLNWLGIQARSWADFLTLPPEAIKSQVSQDKVASVAALWALYDDLKRYSGDDQGRGVSMDRFVNTLALFRCFDSNAHEIREVLAHAVNKLVHVGWNCRKAKNQQCLSILLQEATQWHHNSPMHDSNVLLMFSKGLQGNGLDLIKLVEWYGIDSLSSQDFSERRDGDKVYPSLAQSLISQYMESLMSYDRDGRAFTTDEQKKTAASDLEKLLGSDLCKTWKWESYKLGLLLIDVGRYKSARARLANIVSTEARQAWSWAAYGRAWKDDSEERYEQCLFKGLSVSNDIRTSLSVHEEALQIFAKKGMFSDAKAEAELIENFRSEREWKPSAIVEQVKTQDWFESSEANNNCRETYEALSQNAEDILAEDLPWTEFYVEWENREKGLVGIVIPTGYSRTNSLNVSREIARGALAEQLKIGLCYRGHCGPEKKMILGKVEEYPQAKIRSYFLNNYSGLIDLVKDFGFVRGKPDSVWVPPALLSGLDVKQYQKASGECRSVFRKDKGWVWEASSINLGEESPADSFEKVFEGYLDVTSRGFGFVSDCFVPAPLVAKVGECGRIKVKAKKSWDSKKNRWSWSAYELLGTDMNNNGECDYAKSNGSVPIAGADAP
ncbi:MULTISPECIES: hypothetical protein [unclassified Adlercreutzia]|uniref:DUF7016 domain-containing protein n=1 Tax=unclassified Adlercreutzia TaxID=2636013 RepID=UPI0013EDA755|nr:MULTISPECIES: hypothetical protein [unclassified Adlercreutzia]